MPDHGVFAFCWAAIEYYQVIESLTGLRYQNAKSVLMVAGESLPVRTARPRASSG
jgi:hypothetical protein